MRSTRRTMLKLLGLPLALPLVRLAGAQEAAGRHRFIACYVPNGAHMPEGANGSWRWDGALQPLVERGLRDNTMLLRRLYNGFPGHDPHWQNCAGFLSCEPMVLGDPGVARCGKTLDQYVADAHPGSIRSLELGGIYYHVHPLNDHPGYSNDYLNRISWQAPDKFRSPIPNPAQLFGRLFGAGAGGAEQAAYLRSRRRSVLDALHKDASRLAGRLSADYRPVLESYMDTVREVERDLSVGGFDCEPSMERPVRDFVDPNAHYLLRFELMHRMVVMAMQCGLTNVATFMYGPGVSEELRFAEQLGPGIGHHACAHHQGNPTSIARLEQINRLQVGLFADLLERLKAADLLADTLVLYGSDMSDGNIHYTENLPLLLAGAGGDLRFGEEIDPGERRPIADLHVQVAALLGLGEALPSFGSGVVASTGQPLPLLTA